MQIKNSFHIPWKRIWNQWMSVSDQKKKFFLFILLSFFLVLVLQFQFVVLSSSFGIEKILIWRSSGSGWTETPPAYPKEEDPNPEATDEMKQSGNTVHINIAAVACGTMKYLKVMLKTCLIFSQDVTGLHFIFFLDEETRPSLHSHLTDLQSDRLKLKIPSFTFELHPLWFPESNQVDWEDARIKCTNQRLFFPSLLPHIDSLIYLDTDVIITGNLSELWAEFSRMNSNQIMAMAPAFPRYLTLHGQRNFSTYPNGTDGVNAGVALMNLTRLRAFDFENKIKQVAQLHREDLFFFADQDILNILFYENPSQLYVLSCVFNFYVARCTKQFWCKDSVERGIYIVHSAGGYFKFNPVKPFVLMYEDEWFENGGPAFLSWMYNVTRNFQLGESPWKLMNQLMSQYEEKAGLSCYGNSPKILTQNMEQYLKRLDQNT